MGLKHCFTFRMRLTRGPISYAEVSADSHQEFVSVLQWVPNRVHLDFANKSTRFSEVQLLLSASPQWTGTLWSRDQVPSRECFHPKGRAVGQVLLGYFRVTWVERTKSRFLFASAVALLGHALLLTIADN